MTGDVRGAILAHCAELRRIAQDVASLNGRSGTWTVDDEPPRDPAAWRSEVPVYDGDEGMLVANGPAVAAFVVAFGPAAVLALVAGAEEMCEIHKPTLKNSETGRPYCDGCEGRPNDCPTLRLTARMIGAKVA